MNRDEIVKGLAPISLEKFAATVSPPETITLEEEVERLKFINNQLGALLDSCIMVFEEAAIHGPKKWEKAMLKYVNEVRAHKEFLS